MVFQFENPASYLRNEIRFRRHGMPPKYLQVFNNKIKHVTIENIKSTASRYLNSKDMFIIIVGPEKLKKQLTDIRPVKVIDPEQSTGESH